MKEGDYDKLVKLWAKQFSSITTPLQTILKITV